jgi:hypothetical protein
LDGATSILREQHEIAGIEAVKEISARVQVVRLYFIQQL